METASHAEQSVVVNPTAFEVIRPVSGRKPTRIEMSQGSYTANTSGISMLKDARQSLRNHEEDDSLDKDQQKALNKEARLSLRDLKLSLLKALRAAMMEIDMDLPELKALSGYSKQYLSKILNSTGEAVSIDKIMELLFLMGAENKVTLLLSQTAQKRAPK